MATKPLIFALKGREKTRQKWLIPVFFLGIFDRFWAFLGDFWAFLGDFRLKIV
jgi:hypothetical protein